MAEHVQRVRVVRVTRRQDLDRLPVLERKAEVLNIAVRPDQDRILSQSRPDRGGRVEARRAVGKFQFRESGRMTFMEPEDTELKREDDRGEELPESPAPDRKRRSTPGPKTTLAPTDAV